MMTVDDLAREALKQGFTVERIDGTRFKFLSPDKRSAPVFLSKTASDWRALKNGLAELRRTGFQWPPPANPDEPDPMPEPPPVRVQAAEMTALDELFKELKDARDLLILSAKQLEEADEALTVATSRRDQARQDADDARAHLEEAKKRFDRMCGV